MRNLGERAPYVLMTVLGLLFVAHHYVPHPVVAKPMTVMLQWKQPLAAVIMLTASFSLVWLHVKRVQRRERRWGYSAVMLVSMTAMVFVGTVFGVQEGSLFATWFKHMITPIESTMFALLAFYVASAAFRAFRARTVSATLLLLSAFIVMLALVPAIENNVPFIGDVSAFLLKYPNTAAKRAVLIGVGLGIVSVALKTILGIDKTILKRSE
jgi:hypothetical protein